ncbi:Uncharacterised protein [Cytobacillus firmus]|nr:Uncharacterised protein [Cytobacillus firmus]
MKTLETSRLILRSLTLDDAPRVAEIPDHGGLWRKRG